MNPYNHSRLSRLLAVLMLFSAFISPAQTSAVAQLPTNTAKCHAVEISGSVEESENFVFPFTSDLTFRLESLNRADNEESPLSGWTIVIWKNSGPQAPGRPGNEVSWVLTPPYRGWNARHLSTSYGVSADDAIKRDHTVFFPLSDKDYSDAEKAVRELQSSPGTAEQQKALSTLRTMRSGSVSVKVSDARYEVEEGRKRIGGFKFTAQIIVPEGMAFLPSIQRVQKNATCPAAPIP